MSGEGGWLCGHHQRGKLLTFGIQISCDANHIGWLMDHAIKYIRIKHAVDDNTKPSAKMGRKAIGSHRDSRVAEMPYMVSAPAFFVMQLLNV